MSTTRISPSNDARTALAPRAGDALLVVDMQNDFVTGSLAVPGAKEAIEPLNRAMALFEARDLPVFVTRDWHPPDHCSFAAQGGPWPVHCVAGTAGAELVPALHVPRTATPVLKATRADAEAYSTFAGTELAAELRKRGVRRIFIGGLATDYCVVNSVRDAMAEGLAAVVLDDAIRAVDANPGDGECAVAEMRRLGARFAPVADVEAAAAA